MTNAQENIVKVVLAGAGPGDAGLITVKTAQYLRQASYVLVDRLVNEEILNLYASPSAKIIYVGKQAGQVSISQEEINHLLVEYGKKEGLTVRLKGGDVAFFSQVCFEMEVLRKHNIPFEIVPGITAASGASAILNAPLTARGVSKGVRLLTYYDENFTDTDWRNMADTTDTLVFYMSSKALPDLISNLRDYLCSDKPLAIIEQATTPNQRVLISSVLSFEDDLGNVEIKQPALIIIGEVLKYHECKTQTTRKIESFFKEHSVC